LALPVSRDPRGVFVLLNMLDLFSQRIWDDANNCEPALQVTYSAGGLHKDVHHATGLMLELAGFAAKAGSV
jgi:hypothetical protein